MGLAGATVLLIGGTQIGVDPTRVVTQIIQTDLANLYVIGPQAMLTKTVVTAFHLWIHWMTPAWSMTGDYTCNVQKNWGRKRYCDINSPDSCKEFINNLCSTIA